MSLLDIKKKEALLGAIETAVGAERFNSWFRTMEFVDAGENRIGVPVPNVFYRQFAEQELRRPIEEAFERLFGSVPAIAFTLPESGTTGQPVAPPLTPAPTVVEKPAVPAQPKVSPALQQRIRELRLNADYVFDNFIVGPSNRLAHAAALQVGEKPGKAYNPLFLHGSVGLGKSHLLQAICHEILRRSPHLNVVYMSAENFLNEFVYSLKKGTLESFRSRNRSVDVFVVDDIHFFADKEGSRQELFHTFNTLHAMQKQMIFSSDAPPKEIPNLEERIVSRFEWGFVARVDAPMYEMRLAILHKKAEARGIEIPEEVFHYIATNIQSNIRELEGAIVKVIGMATLTHQPVTIELAKEAIRDSLAPNVSAITIDDIQRVIARYYNLTMDDLRSRTWSKRTSLARQIGIYIARSMTNHSLKEIGMHFGGKDHSTIVYAVSKVGRRLNEDEQIRMDVENLKSRLR